MRYEVMQLADGWDGTDQTVAKAEQLVRDSLSDPVVRLTAEGIVRNLPERDKSAEIKAISRFVRRNIRYTNEGIETIKTPRLLLDEIRTYGKAVGDCDDHVILWLALHKVIGQKVRIRVISQRRNKVASHIFGEVYDSDKRRWVTDDTIKKNRGIGWRIPHKERTADKIYNDGGMEGFKMQYETVAQNGTWHPGGAGRFYMNPNQRPGIGIGQLSVGRSLLPANVQIRSANCLESEGVGQFEFLSSLGPLIEAGGKAAASAVAAKQAAKAASKAAKADRDAQRRIDDSMKQAPPSGGGGSFIEENWKMLAVAGGGILAVLFFMRR